MLGYPTTEEMDLEAIFRAGWSDWEDYQEIATGDPAVIIDLIERLQKEADPPTMLFLWPEGSERNLGIGIGRKVTVFTYQASNRPPYFISEGSCNAEGAEWFCSSQEETEFLARNLVPSDLILPTVNAFIQAGTIPATTRWEQL